MTDTTDGTMTACKDCGVAVPDGRPRCWPCYHKSVDHGLGFHRRCPICWRERDVPGATPSSSKPAAAPALPQGPANGCSCGAAPCPSNGRTSHWPECAIKNCPRCHFGMPCRFKMRDGSEACVECFNRERAAPAAPSEATPPASPTSRTEPNRWATLAGEVLWQLTHGYPDKACAAIDEAFTEALAAEKERRERLHRLADKVNEIRNSIIGLQKVNWSEHIYPLVAVLDEAGIKGMPYPEAREHYGTILERTNAAEARCAELREALVVAKDAIDRDRTGLAAALTRIWKTVGGPNSAGWSWLAEPNNWGSYTWEERTFDTLRAEIGRCLAEVRGLAQKALEDSGTLAIEGVRDADDAIRRIDRALAALAEKGGGTPEDRKS